MPKGRKPKGFNKYKICGDYTIIYLERYSGEILECLIDTEDLPKLIELNIRWCARYNPNTDSFYAHAQKKIYDPAINKIRKTTVSMAKLFLDADFSKGEVINHKNHKHQLDNRKQNLEVTDIPKNATYRKSKNKNNTSGYRNVTWDKRKQKWIVQLQVENKNKVLGEFDNIDEAGAFAAKMREFYYGKFAGEN